MFFAAAREAGFEPGLTSYGLLSAGGDTEGPSVLIETLLAGLAALGVLVFVFASFLALLPLLIAAVCILTTFLIVLGLTTFTDVSFVVQFLIALVGLGVAIDYSLLLVSPWREERAHGHDNHTAVVNAMGTAGKAVLAGRRHCRGLLPRGIRQLPVRAAADRGDHVPAARPDVPVTAPAGQGGAAQPPVVGGRVRSHRLLLAERTWLRRGLRRLGDRCHHVLAAGADLCVPVRPVDRTTRCSSWPA